MRLFHRTHSLYVISPSAGSAATALFPLAMRANVLLLTFVHVLQRSQYRWPTNSNPTVANMCSADSDKNANYSQHLLKLRKEWQAASAGDEHFWINIAKSNPDVDLARWPTMVNDYSKGNVTALTDQVGFLKWQVTDAIDNMMSFVPKLV